MFAFKLIARTEIRTVGPSGGFVCPVSTSIESGRKCGACFPPFCLLKAKSLAECLKEGPCSDSPNYPLNLSYEEMLGWLNLEELVTEARSCAIDIEKRELNTLNSENVNSIYSPLNSNPYVIAMHWTRLSGLEGGWEEHMAKLPKELLDALAKVEKVRKERKEHASRRGSETRQSQEKEGRRELI